MSRVAGLVFLGSLAALAVALALLLGASSDPIAADIVLFPLAYLAFGAVGAVIVRRQPSNVIGRLALATGAFGAIAGLADSWARNDVFMPGREWAAWLTTWLFPASLAAPVLLLLLFPAGRLTSPRWRIVMVMALAGAATLALGNAFTPRMSDHPDLTNPLGIDALTGTLFENGGIGWWPLVVSAFLAAIGLVPRLRRAGGVEREQLKWITYAAALHGASWLVLAFDPLALGQIPQYLLFLTLALIPTAAGIAILRYRLYDIDVVIRRTLVYALVIGLLGAIYVALILVLQTLLSQVTGGGPLPVALSTLATAAMFGPVRARVREAVDRRFYRSRYDAERTLESFGARLRDEVELDAVAQSLLGTAGRAVRPATAGVWVRGRTS
jgi:hypothetical protein